MTYTAIPIESFDPQSTEKILKNSLVRQNFALISQETKSLKGSINQLNEAVAVSKESENKLSSLAYSFLLGL